MKKKKSSIDYESIVSELKEIEGEQEQLGFKINSLKSMMARYVEIERGKK